MLVPHGGKNAELGERWLASDQFDDAGVFLSLEAMLGDKLGGDLGLHSA